MAATKDWTTGAGAATHTSGARRFADGHATDWCVHTVPGYVKAVTVKNKGSGSLYVSWGPAQSGTATVATDHAWELEGDEDRLISFEGEAPTRPSARQFSTFGADGATHAMLFVFESRA